MTSQIKAKKSIDNKNNKIVNNIKSVEFYKSKKNDMLFRLRNNSIIIKKMYRI